MPAERTSSSMPSFCAMCRSTPSAVGGRQILPVHTKSTLRTLFVRYADHHVLGLADILHRVVVRLQPERRAGLALIARGLALGRGALERAVRHDVVGAV